MEMKRKKNTKQNKNINNLKYENNNDKEKDNINFNKLNNNNDNNIDENKNHSIEEHINFNDNENSYYINYNLLPKILKRQNLDNNDIIKINVEGDGNCLMRCLALFIYKDENYHLRIRAEIVKYLENNINDYENIEIDSEIGLLKINDYKII